MGEIEGHLNLRPTPRQAGANRPQAELSFSNSLLFLSATSEIETGLIWPQLILEHFSATEFLFPDRVFGVPVAANVKRRPSNAAMPHFRMPEILT
jgi:hypothetical protein